MKIFLCALTIIFTLTACQSAKDAFTLKKKPSGDEFLVEKKSPLVLPPNYGKLPVPQDQEINSDTKDEEIKSLISNEDKNSSSTEETSSKTTSIEELILKKIK